MLSELIDDVREVRIDRDEKRELLTLEVVDRQGTPLAARSLSDGTLRFLALAVFAMDSKEQGVLCLEEPENGIHPERIPAMIRLLEDIAVDTNEPAGHDNPLTQVIINTHSPAVVSQVQDHSLLVAEAKEAIEEGKRFNSLSFGLLPDTWRCKALEGVNIVSRGKLLSYLNPILPPEEKPQGRVGSRRVADRKDIQLLLPFPEKSC